MSPPVILACGLAREAQLAQCLQVRLVMGAAALEWGDVVDLLGWRDVPQRLAVFAQRSLGDVCLADFAPVVVVTPVDRRAAPAIAYNTLLIDSAFILKRARPVPRKRASRKLALEDFHSEAAMVSNVVRGGRSEKCATLLTYLAPACCRISRRKRHLHFRPNIKAPYRESLLVGDLKVGSGGWIRTNDLWVMSPASYRAAPPRVGRLLACCRDRQRR